MSLSSLYRFFEPAFYDTNHNYWLDDCPDMDKMERYFLAKIISNPLDLDSHVRRILLNIQLNRQEQLIGALQDIFIILEEKGEPIKRLLLSQSENILTADVLAPFYEGINEIMDFSLEKTPYSYIY